MVEPAGAILRCMSPLAARLLAVSVALSALPAVAEAQVSDAERAVAREEYRRGVDAARAERWEEAREAFEAAWELVRLPAILYNLAGAQAQTGLLVEAAESYRRFLREAREPDDLALRPDAEQFLAQVIGRTPALLLEIQGLASRDRVTIDGETVSHAVLGLPMPINAGTHEIKVHRDGSMLAHEPFSISIEERRSISLEVPPAPDPVEVPIRDGSHTTAASDGGVLASPIFWVLVGAAVVGAGVAVFVLTRPEESEAPFDGSLPPVQF
jgi:tetratricopeptide (TPR) repeat protein